MPYIQLAAAIVLELCGTTFLKMSEGFTKLGPSVLCMVLYFFCFFIFSKALVHLNLGVAYATWSGVGLERSLFSRSSGLLFFIVALSCRERGYMVELS